MRRWVGHRTFVEEPGTELAKLLHLDVTRATLSDNYQDEEGAEILPEADKSGFVRKGVSRKEPDAEDRGGLPTGDGVHP